jgi:hypothetical protein
MTSTQATLPVPARYAGRLMMHMHIVTFALVATAILTEGKADDYCRLRVWNDAEWKGCAGHMSFCGTDENLSITYFPPTECYGPRKANDRISSFIVESGVWILCEHSKEEGRGKCIGPYRPGEGEKNLIISQRAIVTGMTKYHQYFLFNVIKVLKSSAAYHRLHVSRFI